MTFADEYNEMKLIKPAFTSKRLDEDKQKDKSITFTVRANEEEIEKLEWVMNFFQEEQRSKAFKQCFDIGFNVLHEPKIMAFRDALLKNVVNNGRKGISIVEGKVKRL